MALSVDPAKVTPPTQPGRQTAPGSASRRVAVEDVEVQLLLDGLSECAGYDLREYDPSMVRRRIKGFMDAEHIKTVSGLQDRALHDAAVQRRLLVALTRRRSTFFGDPNFFGAVRRIVVPLLRTYPFVRIWQVGCSSGEDAYSLAIVMREQGIYERCKIYATDAVQDLVDIARAASYDGEAVNVWRANHHAAGGEAPLDRHLRRNGPRFTIDPALKTNVVFGQHNVVTDGSFNDFHLIVCRAMALEYSIALQRRIHELLYNSLVRLGFLGLGTGGSLYPTPYADCYALVDEATRIYRRTR